VKDKTVMVKVADGVVLEFARPAIATILNDDGTVAGEAEKKS
jgi:preprotein translocase subunit YajC